MYENLYMDKSTTKTYTWISQLSARCPARFLHTNPHQPSFGTDRTVVLTKLALSVRQSKGRTQTDE